MNLKDTGRLHKMCQESFWNKANNHFFFLKIRTATTGTKQQMPTIVIKVVLSIVVDIIYNIF